MAVGGGNERSAHVEWKERRAFESALAAAEATGAKPSVGLIHPGSGKWIRAIAAGPDSDGGQAATQIVNAEAPMVNMVPTKNRNGSEESAGTWIQEPWESPRANQVAMDWAVAVKDALWAAEIAGGECQIRPSGESQ